MSQPEFYPTNPFPAPPASQQQKQSDASSETIFDAYDVGEFYDETFVESGQPRADCAALVDRLSSLTANDILSRQIAANHSMIQSGITFNVYGADEGRERIIPFDILPRIIPLKEWEWIECGLKQRIQALNFFLQDIYNDQRIIKEGVIPEHVVQTAGSFRKQCMGLTPPRDIWCHVTGTDLVRNSDGQLHVLEDNLRCPSGVSYVLQNRQLVKKTFPQLFASNSILPVDDYPGRLLSALTHLMQDRVDQPRASLLSPGSFNSAFFEHSFLASQMGIDLVEGRDLVVKDGFVFMRTTHGFEKLDVLYRRIDDDFLDPNAFRQDSLLGVPGLMESYRSGKIALANAPGTGVADDKVVYTYVPDIIRFYLDEDPLIPNVPTFVCFEEKQRKHVLQNLETLVVKPVNESGGYGLLIGPTSTKAERDHVAEQIRDNPRNFIAQPVLALSRAPVLTDDGPEGRHVDLRPFIVNGENIYVLPGGLTRVALKKGSLVVNSSQGGGSKDTWVVRG